MSFECFASPLNCYFGRYCSAFPDTDGCFGSLGSFFHFRPREGSFEANPPFVPAVVEAMAKHIEALLDRSCERLATSSSAHSGSVSSASAAAGDGSTRPLSFVVVIPHWDRAKEDAASKAAAVVAAGTAAGGSSGQPHDVQRVAVPAASGPGWRLLRGSKYLVKHLRVAKEGHGYVEGSQHVRSTRFKTSRFDSSIFIIQNDAGRRRWPVTKEACAALRQAFASKFEEELSERRSGGGCGVGDGGAEEVLRAVLGGKVIEEGGYADAGQGKSHTVPGANVNCGMAMPSKKSKKNPETAAPAAKKKKKRQAAIRGEGGNLTGIGVPKKKKAV